MVLAACNMIQANTRLDVRRADFLEHWTCASDIVIKVDHLEVLA